jgi:hypothetical protein
MMKMMKGDHFQVENEGFGKKRITVKWLATNHDVTVQGGSSGQESVTDGGLLFAISKLKNKSLSLFDVI